MRKRKARHADSAGERAKLHVLRQRLRYYTTNRDTIDAGTGWGLL